MAAEVVEDTEATLDPAVMMASCNKAGAKRASMWNEIAAGNDRVSNGPRGAIGDARVGATDKLDARRSIRTGGVSAVEGERPIEKSMEVDESAPESSRNRASTLAQLDGGLAFLMKQTRRNTHTPKNSADAEQV
ncbi:hypothetical protein PMN64_36160 [Bradyrhizobium sp. UFLA01-814]|uniref:hypothetical protein n=1 Tax=Bradyrhizobium sp. UFLA01-814 TaxID=3023480 RepID=UPI00398B304D